MVPVSPRPGRRPAPQLLTSLRLLLRLLGAVKTASVRISRWSLPRWALPPRPRAKGALSRTVPPSPRPRHRSSWGCPVCTQSGRAWVSPCPSLQGTALVRPSAQAAPPGRRRPRKPQRVPSALGAATPGRSASGPASPEPPGSPCSPAGATADGPPLVRTFDSSLSRAPQPPEINSQPNGRDRGPSNGSTCRGSCAEPWAERVGAGARRADWATARQSSVRFSYLKDKIRPSCDQVCVATHRRSQNSPDGPFLLCR